MPAWGDLESQVGVGYLLYPALECAMLYRVQKCKYTTFLSLIISFNNLQTSGVIQRGGGGGRFKVDGG